MPNFSSLGILNFGTLVPFIIGFWKARILIIFWHFPPHLCPLPRKSVCVCVCVCVYIYMLMYFIHCLACEIHLSSPWTRIIFLLHFERVITIHIPSHLIKPGHRRTYLEVRMIQKSKELKTWAKSSNLFFTKSCILFF